MGHGHYLASLKRWGILIKSPDYGLARRPREELPTMTDTSPSGQSTDASWRGPAGTIIILMAVGLAMGLTLRMPTMIGANDISRWCTVWALLERGTYAIDECPWQAETQDKVFKIDPWSKASIAGTTGETNSPQKHYYSSKPPMLPTMIAGSLYPFRMIAGLPLDHKTETPRIPRNVRVNDDSAPGGQRVEVQSPEPFQWSLHVVYLKPVLIVLNVLPLALMLVGYRKFLDNGDNPDWSWLASLSAFSFGTFLTIFTSTLNNHLVAAWAAFFAFMATIKAINDPARNWQSFAKAGFFSAFCACNELPALSFFVILALVMAGTSLKQTAFAFLPAALIPFLTFFASQYAAMGSLIPAYAEFGGDAYEYAGSYWTTPLDLDYYDKHPEPRAVYLTHMLVGHHGIFSLSPIFLFAMAGIASRMGSRTYRTIALGLACVAIVGAGCGWRIYNEGSIDLAKMSWAFWLAPLWLMIIPQSIEPRSNPGKAVAAWVAIVLSVVVVGFYGYKTNNYGGSTQGLRWLFWLIPLWVVFLPDGFRAGAENLFLRRLGYLALAFSFLSVGYAIRSPWTHPWLLDLMDRAGWYPLIR